METKRFTKNDNGFICKACGFKVLPLSRTSRNHCPRCLCSLHVDLLPGDRACSCGGIMRPLRTFPDPKKGYVILHKCEKCGFEGRNKAALRIDARDKLDDDQYDDIDLIISLSTGLI